MSKLRRRAKARDMRRQVRRQEISATHFDRSGALVNGAPGVQRRKIVPQVLRFRIPLGIVWLSFIFGCLSAPDANAQKLPIEVYGGYSLLHPKVPVDVSSDPSTSKTVQSLLGNLSGWNGGVTVGITKSFAVSGDFSGYYKNFDTSVDGFNL